MVPSISVLFGVIYMTVSLETSFGMTGYQVLITVELRCKSNDCIQELLGGLDS